MYINGGEKKMLVYHGRPLSLTVDGNVLWEFPNGETGVVTMDDARYLCGLMNGSVRAYKTYVQVIQ